MECRSGRIAAVARTHLRLLALQILLFAAAPLLLHADERTLEDDETLSSEAKAGPGLWNTAPERADQATPDDDRHLTIEQLQAIGYVSGSTAPRGNGIVSNDPSRAWSGINLYTSGHEPGAILMDMEGRELHRWKFEYRDAFPDSIWADHPNTEWWRRVYLYPNGDVLAIVEGFALLKLDKDSNLLWASPVNAHHDLDVRPNGDIYVLTREASIIARVNPEDPVLEDFITILGPDGTEKRKVSLLSAFENSEYRKLYSEQNRTRGDLFHTNSLEVLDDRLSDRMPAFRAGRILTSMNNLSVIAVVDLDRERVEWAIKGGSRGQHDPKILDDGHLLLFDNRSTPGASKVLEFDFSKGRPVWQYSGTKEQPFFSKHLGTAQRLPNGNTLITESESGRAFEVTRDKRIVWEFFNPHRAGEDDRYIATIFELLRLPPDFPLDWMPKRAGD